MTCANRHIPTPDPDKSRDVLEENVLLSLIRAHAHIQDQHHQVFREHGLTAQQYNVLRILHVRGQHGLCSSEISALMTTRVPDMTRLLDRMERDGLLERQRSEADRRMVKVFLHSKGRELCQKLDQPLVMSSQQLLAHLSREQQLQLQSLLDSLYR